MYQAKKHKRTIIGSFFLQVLEKNRTMLVRQRLTRLEKFSILQRETDSSRRGETEKMSQADCSGDNLARMRLQDKD